MQPRKNRRSSGSASSMEASDDQGEPLEPVHKTRATARAAAKGALCVFAWCVRLVSAYCVFLSVLGISRGPSAASAERGAAPRAQVESSKGRKPPAKTKPVAQMKSASSSSSAAGMCISWAAVLVLLHTGVCTELLCD